MSRAVNHALVAIAVLLSVLCGLLVPPVPSSGVELGSGVCIQRDRDQVAPCA